MNSDKLLQTKVAFISTLNEVEKRRYAGILAIEIGRGGISKINKLSGMSRDTIKKGKQEVETQEISKPSMRLRKIGGGRKQIKEKEPKIINDLDKIMDGSTAGNPMNHLRWSLKSTRTIASELQNKKRKISYQTVRRLLKQKGYSLKGNKKSKEGEHSLERNKQFEYINKKVEEFKVKKYPIISVDTKKKELVGNFKNPGRTWSKKGEAEEVNVYDFPSLAKGKAVPYGIYEILKNNGFVNVGISRDTAEFAVNSIDRWWKNIGKKNYPGAKALLICADCGGSNGNRNRLWKYCLNKFAVKNKLKITVCHYPPGTSKWNKIEHKMFSFISMNWRGKPLISFETVVNLIGATKTKKGLIIKAKIDRRKYKKGKKVPTKELEEIRLEKHLVNPVWNYSIYA